MTLVDINTVLAVYKSLLNKTLTYTEADRWAWSMIEKLDSGMLSFFPPEEEGLIWELIHFLYGIDIPDLEDRNKAARTDNDIIDFLKDKKVYDKTKALD